MKKTIFLHGLGQTPSSWIKTIENIGIEESAVCPNLSTLVQGREANYENLYAAFSDICNEHSEKVVSESKPLSTGSGGWIGKELILWHPSLREKRNIP